MPHVQNESRKRLQQIGSRPDVRSTPPAPPHMLFEPRLFSRLPLFLLTALTVPTAPLLAQSAPLELKQASIGVQIGGQPGAEHGVAVCAVQDFDGDGVLDFGVGAPGTDRLGIFGSTLAEDAGRVEVRSGATGAELYSWPASGATEPGTEARMGAAMATLEDGTASFVAGSPGHLIAGSPTGRVRVFGEQLFGAFGPIYTWDGVQAGEEFGAALAVLDGSAGFTAHLVAVGAPRFDVLLAGGITRVDAGRVDLYQLGSPTPIASYLGQSAGDRFGECVSDVGDMDGDGKRELAIGAPGAGTVSVFGSATDYSLLDTFAGTGEFGASISSIEDVTGGGQADLVVGDPSWSPNLPFPENFGRVTVLESETGQILYTVEGDYAGAGLGDALTSADLDGDGGLDWFSIQRGQFLTGSRLRAFDGASGSERPGYAQWAGFITSGLARLGDLDGDGGDEVLYGLPKFEEDLGAVAVVGARLTGAAPAPGVFTVDDNGPADFASIGVAAFLVPEGSTLVVQSGEYKSFTLDHSMTVVGPVTSSLFGVPARAGDVRVFAAETCSLLHLTLNSLRVVDVPGRTSLHSLRLEHGGVSLWGCPQATASKITSFAGIGTSGAPVPGFTVSFSQVHIDDSTLVGADGNDDPVGGFPSSGRAGLEIGGDGSRVVLARSYVEGGDGGDTVVTQPPSFPGAGGPAVSVGNSAVLDLRGGFLATNLVSGQDGFNGSGQAPLAPNLRTTPGASAEVSSVLQTVTVSDPLAVTFLGESRPTLTVSGAALQGQQVTSSIHSEPGDMALLLITATPAAIQPPLLQTVPLWVDTATLLALLVVNIPSQAGGQTILNIPSQPVLTGVQFYLQAAVIEPSGLYTGSNAVSLPIAF